MSTEILTNLLLRLEDTPSYVAYNSFANYIEALDPDEFQISPLRIAVLRNFTFEPILPILKSEIVRMGFYPEVYLGDHDSIAADVLNTDSALYRFTPDVIIIAQWLEALAPQLTRRFLSFSRDEIGKEVKRILDTISTFVSAIRRQSNVPILLNNFPLSDYATLGILDAQSDWAQINTIRRLNQELLCLALEFPNVFIVDYEHLMARVGIYQAFDERYWHIGRAPISRSSLMPLGLEYVRFLRALKGRSYKCLILDCDDTLWGGIVGEDGMKGIRLGPTYPGSSYVSFQQEIMNLHDRGVILALCSKNNETDVLDVLEKHPNMILRKEHFAIWQINWDNKATNIQRIVDKLNIGLDSIVFADDNEYEIGLVKSQLPEVATLKLPQEPSQLRSELMKRGYFDSLSFSEEDRTRNAMYRDEAKRKLISTQVRSIEEYLRKLEIQVTINRVEELYVPRVAQLTQKTNQFNLTTKRYTEADIARFVADDQYDVWYISLKDKISDMGIVGTAIVKYDETIAYIDSFLLSCRALGRGIEDALLAQIIRAAHEWGCTLVRGDFIPTKKNGQTAHFYEDRGFFCSKDEEGKTEWEFTTSEIGCTVPVWIEIINSKANTATYAQN